MIRLSWWNGWFASMQNLDRELRNKFGWILPRRKISLCTLIGKGMGVGTWKRPEESSANAGKDVIDGNSSRTIRGQIAKCVRALRWACVERAWPLIRTPTAATHDGVSIRTSCCWFASTSNLGRRHSDVMVMISQYSCSSRRDATLHLNYKVSTTVTKQGKGSCAQTSVSGCNLLFMYWF